MTDAGGDGTGQPIAEGARADALDALRGFALLGILISHIPDFSGHALLTPAGQLALDRTGLDTGAALLQDFLIRGKFYSLFSLLFGIGFSVQLDSAARRGADFARHFARRLTVLLGIGIVHACLWYGDILADYALIGFALIPTRHWTTRKLAGAVAVVFAVRLFWPIAVYLLMSSTAPTVGSGDPDADFRTLNAAFGSGDLQAVFLANLSLVRIKLLQIVYDGRAISILAMFLLGTWAGRLGLYRNLPHHQALFGRLFGICAPVGLIGNVLLTPLHAVTPAFPPTAMWVVEGMLYALAVPAMAIAYACGFAWLWSHGGRGLLSRFAPAGRMALTTYVSQTGIGIALFYGVGLGLRGHVGLVDGTLLALGIFVLQGMFASLWLRWFRFGPIEWLWRRMTYGVPIAFRR